jgi:hypothetical protein
MSKFAHYYRDEEDVLAFSVSSRWHGVPFFCRFEGILTPQMVKNQFTALDAFLRERLLLGDEITRQGLYSLRDLLYYAAERGYGAKAS